MSSYLSDSSESEVVEESFEQSANIDTNSIEISDSELSDSVSGSHQSKESISNQTNELKNSAEKNDSFDKNSEKSVSYTDSESEVVETEDENEKSEQSSKKQSNGPKYANKLVNSFNTSKILDEHNPKDNNEKSVASNDNEETNLNSLNNTNQKASPQKSSNKIDSDDDSPIKAKRPIRNRKAIWSLDSTDESNTNSRNINAGGDSIEDLNAGDSIGELKTISKRTNVDGLDDTQNKFDLSITNKLSSTISEDSQGKNFPTSDLDTSLHNNSPTSTNKSPSRNVRNSIPEILSDSDKSVEIISKDPTMVSILSAPSNLRNESTPVLDDNSSNIKYKNLSNSSKLNTPVARKSVTPSVQKKITEYIKQSPRESQGVDGLNDISQTYFFEQQRKLDDLKSELQTCLKVSSVLGPKLPDNGRRMSDRIERLKVEIKNQIEYVSSLQDKRNNKTNEKRNSIEVIDCSSPPWPTAQKQGQANENVEQVNVAPPITLECLKEICGCLETCPAEDVLANEPKGLKISLMNHQRHALAWMTWRENQRPRGGILADDMGLGKTLTMISLILDVKQRKELEDDDDDYEKSKKRRRGGTLVVCPASLIGQWKDEIEKRVKSNLLTVSLHHGLNRETKAKYLCRYDVIVTTYNIVSREHKLNGALFDVKWERIILDEAHVIRNHKSQGSIACCALRSKFRWILTGTPVQNKEMDVYALLKFLKCSPFDEIGNWKRWINKSAGGQQRLNMLMKALLLRRTKSELMASGAINCLPEKTMELIEFDLDKDEMAVYQKMLALSRSMFAQFLNQQREKHQAFSTGGQTWKPINAHGAFCEVHKKVVVWNQDKEVKSHQILVLLLRLRQICCHPGLIEQMLDDDEDTSQIEGFEKENSDKEFNILEQMAKLRIDDAGTQPCMCSDIFGGLQASGQPNVFRKSNKVFDLRRASSKIKKVLEILEEKVLDTEDKAIIVSQWTGVLDILKPHLLEKGINFTTLTGSVPVKMRDDVISSFNKSDSGSKVLLLSLTAGGVGLNLIGANHLFLVDLHWNPQLEAQAQDRVFRVGQKKPVYIYKFMSKETVEERIKTLQEQKLSIANGVLSGANTSEWTKLKLDDLKGLFGLN